MDELPAFSNRGAAAARSHEICIDFARNFPPPSPLVGERLTLAFHELEGTDMASTIRFPRFTGTARDRAAAASWVARRLGTAPDPERVVLSNGSQSTLVMLLAALVQPGNVLLTEELTYAAIKPIVSLFGIKLFPVKIDHEGIIPDALEKACIKVGRELRALYCMPTLHNPTAATMSLERRTVIAGIARRHNLWIFEDDIYGVLPETAPPPLQTLAPERTWYILGLSKSLAAQLRVAYTVAPSGTIAREVFWPGIKTTNWMVAPLIAEIATRWVEQGDADAILRSVRAETNIRQELARNSLPSSAIGVPPFCYHVWLKLPHARSAAEFEQAVRRQGVTIALGDSFSAVAGGFDAHFRIGIGVPSDRVALRTGLDILNINLHQIPSNPRRAGSGIVANSGLHSSAVSVRTNRQPHTVPAFLFADQTLHIGCVEEADCFALRKIGLWPAEAKAVPAYAYAPEQFHLAAFVGIELLSVATFLMEDQSEEGIFSANGSSWRLRGMATHPQHRCLGYATAILEHGTRLLRRRRASLLWANGRSTAIGFYLERGFSRVGEERFKPGAQPHYRIERRL